MSFVQLLGLGPASGDALRALASEQQRVWEAKRLRERQGPGLALVAFSVATRDPLLLVVVRYERRASNGGEVASETAKCGPRSLHSWGDEGDPNNMCAWVVGGGQPFT